MNARRLAPPLILLLLLAAAARAQDDSPRVPREMEEARRLYPPEVTRALLEGTIPSPTGFDEAIKERLGEERLKRLRAGNAEVQGQENDVAAVCLARLKVPPESLKAPPGNSPTHVAEEPVTVRRITSDYPVAPGKTSGAFHTGQDADIALSAIDFDQTGGPLLFNHPMGIATDGTRLFLADTYSNRVLVWNSLPDGNTPPDLVLGQANFHTNATGNALDQMNFPVNVSAGGGRLVVADAQNHRILVWNKIPEKSATPADFAIVGERDHRGIDPSKTSFHWPWGVWTDGTRLVLSSTMGGAVLIWNSFPKSANQPADLLLHADGKFGTPRTITSDGKCLIVGDHNARVGVEPGARFDAGGDGTFFWKTFPTKDDQPHDYFRRDPSGHGPWLRGTFLADGRLCLLGGTLHLWSGFPKEAATRPDLSIRGYDFRPGDHTGVAATGERLYIVCGNGNRVVVYRTIPTKADQPPDFAIGAPDINADTLQTNFIISNPAPATDGKSLFVASDFDRKLYVWKHLPDRSGAHPDFVYSLGGQQAAIWGPTLAVAGGDQVHVWRKLPLDGELPDLSMRATIGGVRLKNVRGVALDDRHFYLSDVDANRVYVWKGIPSSDSKPAFSLEIKQPWKLSSDGEHLVVASPESHGVWIYQVKDLSGDATPRFVGEQRGPGPGGPPPERRFHFNMTPSGVAWRGKLFVADAPFGRVLFWSSIDDAVAGKMPDAILGAADLDDVQPEIGRGKLFYPAAMCFDGAYLWVGETKFSERLLRFSPKP